MPKRDAFASVIQGDRATGVLREWRDTYLAGYQIYRTSMDSQTLQSSQPYVFAEARAMVDSIESALSIMVDVGFTMSDEVDETVWGPLADQLCTAEEKLHELMGIREIRPTPHSTTSSVQAVRNWADAVNEDGAGMLPCSTLHLATLPADINSVVEHASQHQTLTIPHYQFLMEIFDLAFLIDSAANTPVVRDDDDATVPVLVSNTYCQGAFCLRTDGLDDMFVCHPAPSIYELGHVMRMRLCPQHQKPLEPNQNNWRT